jgi:predicted XRE-type DNA-binding protein
MVKRNQKNNVEEIEFTVGSGNVYADIGLQNPEEIAAKAKLAMLITDIIKTNKLTQQQAADLMNIDQPKVSKITRGLLSEFTLERLMKFVVALGFDIEIKPKPHRVKTPPPAIRVELGKGSPSWKQPAA